MSKLNGFEKSETFELVLISDIDFSKCHPDFTFVNQNGEVIRDYHDFYYGKAQHYQKVHLSRVLVLVENMSDEVLAFMTLSASSVQLNKQERMDVYQDEIPFSNSPSMIIGQLCVSKYGREKYYNLGSLMISFARTIALMVEKKYAACRFLMVDAAVQKNPTLVRFYSKNGFELNNQNRRHTISMRKDIFKDNCM